MQSTELYDQIVSLAEEFTENGGQYKEKGTKAAAARARKNSLEMGKLLADYRKATIAEGKEG